VNDLARTGGFNINRVLVYIILILGTVFCLLPLVWMIRTSLMKLAQVFTVPIIWIPKPFVFRNYPTALSFLPFARYFLNTLVIGILTVAGVIVSCSISAYGFSRLRWPGRNIVFSMVISTMMLPYAATLIPTFLGWNLLGVIDTYIPLIVPAWFAAGPWTGAFSIFLLRQFFRTIPHELDEAAFIDGASRLTIFTRIIFPLSRSGLVVVALLAFLRSWNDFLYPLVYLNHDIKFTLSLGLQLFQSTFLYGSEWQLMMAASVIVVIPVIIIFIVGQRYLVQGISLSGIKE
jgi:multiple sugar transport system permease protein